MKKYLQTFLGMMFAIILSLMMLPTEAKAATEIVIPDQIDGYLIRGISANSF